MFEKASRKKFRFQTTVGVLTTEDLWGLKLTQLNDLAKNMNRQIKEAEEESFIKKPSTANKELMDKFEIVKRIIAVLMEEEENKTKAKDRKEQRDRLLEILNKKQNESLETMSVEDIKKQLAALED